MADGPEGGLLRKLERALGLETNPVIFFISSGFIAVFVPLAVIFNEPFAAFFGEVTTWVSTNLGWFYIAAVTGLLVFLLWLAFSRFGGVRLGDDDSRPEFSDLSWFTMLFAAGIGTVLMFWGVAEPLTHFAHPPFLGIEAGSPQAAQRAMDLSLYHFGLHTWTIFALPGLALAYFIYRHKLPLRVSSIFYPVLGERIHGPVGWAIDTFAVVGTMFGVATSLGLGTLQVNTGLEYLIGLDNTPGNQVLIISVITVIATISVALGLDKGVKHLSELNIGLAVLLLIFVFFAGPTVHILQTLVQSVGSYLSALPSLSTWNDAFADDGWQQKWTLFYWAWTISWAPFVGIFVARISKGRTIREFIFGVLLAPTCFSILWFSVFGAAAMHIEGTQGGLATQVDQEVAVAIFVFLEALPWATITSGLGVLIIVIFFTTSSDSASLVIDMLSSGGNPHPPVRQRVFWAVAEGAVAATLLLAGGFEALQNVITTLGFPFCALLVFMAYATLRALQLEEKGVSMRPPSSTSDAETPPASKAEEMAAKVAGSDQAD